MKYRILQELCLIIYHLILENASVPCSEPPEKKLYEPVDFPEVGVNNDDQVISVTVTCSNHAYSSLPEGRLIL